MKKRKINVEIMIIVALVALLAGYKLLDATSYRFVEAKAVHYLCQKYDAQPEDFELVDYNQSHIYWEEFFVFLEKPVWIDFSFEFEYNDRKFIVNRFEGKFYDDYQLDDIEKWCTEWLQNNVDERIIGLEIDSRNIAFYQKNANKSNYYILTEEDAEEFLNNYSLNYRKKYAIFIYYHDENIDKFDVEEYNEEMGSKLRLKLVLGDNVLVSNSNYSVIKETQKYETSEWINHYKLS